ncbi:MAG: UDP-N-acetylmuramate dehydrogenase [Bacteroidota bacterium]|nr:UDP-N-acetylmuramate dehydrogenase [Bacteroidota bacterium]
MIRSENFSLKKLNTFGLEVKSRFFYQAGEEGEILEFLESYSSTQGPLLILGGGSNILFTSDYPGTVLRICTKGRKKISQDQDFVYVSVAAGEVWDEIVDYCVENGWGGMENLSLIPGNTGAAPVQNIGAYGIEAKDILYEVETIDIETGKKSTITAAECRFGYRDSIFKNELKGRIIITSVIFRLQREPVLNLSYGKIREELLAMKTGCPDIRTVRQAVINIRRKKLPDPAVLGSAGSFFKNPVIPEEKFLELKDRHPDISFHLQENCFKLSAAWLIDQCGWKGKRFGDAGVHNQQPLVLVNYGRATGTEILELSGKIVDSVEERFGVKLETEVNII